jgi:hypothetical protein
MQACTSLFQWYPSTHTKQANRFSSDMWKVLLLVVFIYIGDNIAYRHGLHFCQEVYPYRNQNKV